MQAQQQWIPGTEECFEPPQKQRGNRGHNVTRFQPRPDRLQWIDGTEPPRIPCGNPHCREWFYPDPNQPGKKYHDAECRTQHNNALISERQRLLKPPAPKWTLTDPRSEDVDWDAYSAFAGGTEEGARAFLDQFEAVQAMKRIDRRKKYETEE